MIWGPRKSQLCTLLSLITGLSSGLTKSKDTLQTLPQSLYKGTCIYALNVGDCSSYENQVCCLDFDLRRKAVCVSIFLPCQAERSNLWSSRLLLNNLEAIARRILFFERQDSIEKLHHDENSNKAINTRNIF